MKQIEVFKLKDGWFTCAKGNQGFGYGKTPIEAVGDYVLKNSAFLDLGILFLSDEQLEAKVLRQSADK